MMAFSPQGGAWPPVHSPGLGCPRKGGCGQGWRAGVWPVSGLSLHP